MLICPRCKIEDDNGKSTCGACGGPLVTEQEPQTALEEVKGKNKALRMCPKCKMLYEKETNCLRCGTPLVFKIPSQEREDFRSTRRHGKRTILELQVYRKKLATPLRDSNRINLVTQPPSKKKEEPLLDHKRDAKKTPLWPQAQRFYGTAPAAIKRASRDIVNSTNTTSPGTLAMVALILFVVVAGYFLLQRAMLGTPMVTPMATNVTIPIHASVKPLELGKIRGLLDNIRLANLQKNIELFMSCYAGDFGDREAKMRSTLESWKASDYLDLSYRLIRQSVSGDTANIEVEWLSKISQKINGQLEEGRIVVEALLKKECDTWKIKEIKTVN